MMVNALGSRKCKQCKQVFAKRMPLQYVCDAKCAIAYASVLADKNKRLEGVKMRRETKLAKEKLKNKSDWAKEAQQWVNKYVRLRDKHLGCCSCDKPAGWHGQWHASHFRTTKAASAIRFNLWNIHKGCSVCNNWLSGNIGDYETKLRIKIGDKKVDWLKSQNQPAPYSIDYLKRLKGIFKKKCALIEKRL